MTETGYKLSTPCHSCKHSRPAVRPDGRIDAGFLCSHNQSFLELWTALEDTDPEIPGDSAATCSTYMSSVTRAVWWQEHRDEVITAHALFLLKTPGGRDAVFRYWAKYLDALPPLQ